MITLEVLQGEQAGRVFELDAAAITIGRAPGNQVVLGDYHLSGEHGQIFREDDQYIYRDLRSTNGSRIRRDGAEVPLDGSEAPLRDGDQILLGDPSGPVILACKVKLPETPDSERVLAKRTIGDLPAVERDPGLPLKMLWEASKKLEARGLDLDQVYIGIAEAVFDLVPKATHFAIGLADESDGRMTTLRSCNRAGVADEEKVSRAMVRRVMRERAAVLIADAPTELGGTESIMGARIRSTIGVPLWRGDQIRGLIQCDNRDSAGMFRERDLELLLVFASLAAGRIENARWFKRVQLAEEQQRGENRYLKTREEKRRFPDIIGESPAMLQVLRQLEKVIDTRATVCIEGETGTGKELIASAIHYQGSRRDKLFVAQNCAAVPENLLESELFGHKKGAFTGADHDKKGLFEIADGGTLFLDEIGEMSLGLQAKLLRVLQESEVRPVGATQARKIDVRIICATNRSLEKEVERGTFRQDLYYRLKVFPLRLPPLRERREDIPRLVDHFLRKYQSEMKKPTGELTDEAVDAMSAYAWPGNIRELENEVQRLVIQADVGGPITVELLSPQIRKVEGLLGRIAPKKGTLKDMMEEVERWLLTEALREHGGNKTKTAETLGITREGLHKKLSKYGM